MSPGTSEQAAILGQPLTLPCGVVLKHRIAKSAMSDSLGDGTGNPTPAQRRLYARWAQGGAALSLIGEVQPTPRFPEKPGNLVLDPEADLDAMRALAAAGAGALWLQLGHAGALAHAPISAPEGPSALNIGTLRCTEMSDQHLRALPGQFARAAALARRLGFAGVQIHAAHGFLFSQFLSPLFNRRTDAHGGPIENRCRLLIETIGEVRAAVGPDFPVALKINASDGLEGGLSEADALAALRLLDATSLDLIDISGGTYFPGAAAASDSAGSGPYFTAFAARARSVTDTPLMVTGGFKTRAQAAAAVAEGLTDMVGIARGWVLDPNLAATWLTDAGGDPAFPRFRDAPEGGVTAWYTMRLTALAEDREDGFASDPHSALADYDARDAVRAERWTARFPIAP